MGQNRENRSQLRSVWNLKSCRADIVARIIKMAGVALGDSGGIVIFQML